MDIGGEGTIRGPLHEGHCNPEGLPETTSQHCHLGVFSLCVRGTCEDRLAAVLSGGGWPDLGLNCLVKGLGSSAPTGEAAAGVYSWGRGVGRAAAAALGEPGDVQGYATQRAMVRRG